MGEKCGKAKCKEEWEGELWLICKMNKKLKFLCGAGKWKGTMLSLRGYSPFPQYEGQETERLKNRQVSKCVC